ncbi:hypothetical protein DFP72DRAFT_890441, partial [Ephemerocybe angulata]
MSRAKRVRTAGSKSLAGVSTSSFGGSSDFSISKFSATTSGRDTIIHNVKIVNQNNQLATFTAGAIAGSVSTVGLYGGTGWAGCERVGSMERRCSMGIGIEMLFLDLLAILSAIGFVASRVHPPRSVKMLYGSARHFSNTLDDGAVRAIASAIEESGIDVRVEQVQQRDNGKARLLSHLMVDEYRHEYPPTRFTSSLHLEPFFPRNGY